MSKGPPPPRRAPPPPARAFDVDTTLPKVADLNIERLARMASVDGSWFHPPKGWLTPPDRQLTPRNGYIVVALASGALWIAIAAAALLGLHALGVI